MTRLMYWAFQARHECAVVAEHRRPLLHFNHAIALDDQRCFEEALNADGRALALDTDFADAHYNAAVLLEQLGDARGALQHFNAYRRLERSEGI